MHLYLVQHAEAKREEDDPRRGLTDKGIKDIMKMAAYAEKLGIQPARIVHSGKKRALETAEVMAKHLKSPIEAVDGLNPLDDASIWAGRLDDINEDLMIVGHLPHLSRLASILLCETDAGISVAFEMAGVACLSRLDNRWYLKWMVTPATLP